MSKKKIIIYQDFIYYNIFLLLHIIIRANDSDRLIFFLYILIVCVSTDIGGYIFGKIFKGPKLIKISPKKTYSGVIGGYLMSIIIYYLFINFNY